MKDWKDISIGVRERLGLGSEWKMVVDDYILYCMSMWGRGVKDIVGIRVEEDFDIRMDLRFYKKNAYSDVVYQRIFRSAIKHNRWKGYRRLLKRGLRIPKQEPGRIL